MVFEHLDHPEKQLREIARVLSKDGKLIFHTPNKFGYATLIARLIAEAIKAKLVYVIQGGSVPLLVEIENGVASC